MHLVVIYCQADTELGGPGSFLPTRFPGVNDACVVAFQYSSMEGEGAARRQVLVTQFRFLN